MDNETTTEQRDVNAEILERLERIEAGVLATNGRVTALESTVSELVTWRDDHQKWAESGRMLITDVRQATERVEERMTEIALACQTTPGNLEHAVARVLDKRQTTENAAKYAALVARFGDDPEDALSRWNGLRVGLAGVGWKVLATVAGFLATGLLMWLMALWTISQQGGAA